jgi:competence protein ComEA
MKKILFFMVLSVSFLFSAINVQTASKDELMCIKGIGEKKATAILKYRKSNKVKSADDLINIKGFGKVIIANVKAGKKSVACGGKKTAKKSKSKKVLKKDTQKKTTSKKEDSSVKKSEKKKIEDNPKAKKTDSKKEE